MIALRSPVVLAAAAMIVLPFALLAGGLTMTSATDVVIFAIDLGNGRTFICLDLIGIRKASRLDL